MITEQEMGAPEAHNDENVPRGTSSNPIPATAKDVITHEYSWDNPEDYERYQDVAKLPFVHTVTWQDNLWSVKTTEGFRVTSPMYDSLQDVRMEIMSKIVKEYTDQVGKMHDTVKFNLRKMLAQGRLSEIIDAPKIYQSS